MKTPYDCLSKVQRDVLREFLMEKEDDEIAAKLCMDEGDVARIVDELGHDGWLNL